MEIVLIIFLIVLLVINGVILFLFIKPKKEEPKEDDKAMQLLLQQINELGRNVDQKLGDTSKSLQDSLNFQTKDMQESLKFQTGESYKVIKDITERLTKLDEANKQVISLGDRIESLQNILKNPKQRGVLGEYYLETLLKNALPPGSYEMQYNLGKNSEGSGEDIVDAVVFVKDKIIPIDSKFSLENYNRFAEEQDEARKLDLEKIFVNDLKLRVKETAKYIKPDQGTLEFAFMFIPHEAIYYDLLVNKVGDKRIGQTENLIEKAANEYKVIVVSPTSFLAYLQTVLQGLRALQVEEKTKEIIKQVAKLSKHIGNQDRYMESLGKTLGTTVNHYNKAYQELKKIDKDVYRISEETSDVEPLKLDKPELE